MMPSQNKFRKRRSQSPRCEGKTRAKRARGSLTPYFEAKLLAAERLEVNFQRARKKPRMEIFAGRKDTLLGNLIYIVGEILDGKLESQSWPVGVTQGLESQGEILREMTGNPRA